MIQQSVVDCFAMSLLMIYLPVRGHERWDGRAYTMKRKLLFKFSWAYSIPGVNRFWQEKCVITFRCDAIKTSLSQGLKTPLDSKIEMLSQENHYQTFQPKLGPSSVVDPVQGNVIYIYMQ